MRNCTCKQCGRTFVEDDSNPAIHYSNPATICPHCEIYNKKKVGEWYQDKDGEYKQKPLSIEDIRADVLALCEITLRHMYSANFDKPLEATELIKRLRERMG